MKNENELMMKMCASENDGVGVCVNGVYYFYENFEDGDPITRIYKHFGMDHKFTFYSMCWAHQKRIKEFMNLYEIMVANSETERAEKNERMVDFMIEKIMILHELKLAGIDISENLEKMYREYGKEEFQRAALTSGYGFILK